MPREYITVSLNCGSSSLKFAVYRFESESEQRLLNGAAERIGLADGQLWARDPEGALLLDRRDRFSSHNDVLQVLLEEFRHGTLPPANAVGHRVVHGGPTHIKPELVTRGLLDNLRSCVPLAPLHLPS